MYVSMSPARWVSREEFIRVREAGNSEFYFMDLTADYSVTEPGFRAELARKIKELNVAIPETGLVIEYASTHLFTVTITESKLTVHTITGSKLGDRLTKAAN